MAINTKTTLDLQVLVDIALALDLEVTENAGWLKVQDPKRKNGEKDGPYRVYLAKGKTGCRTITLAGFGAGMPGTVEPPGKNGSVQAHLDMEQEDPMGRLNDILVEMINLPPPLKATGIQGLRLTKKVEEITA